MSLGVGCKLILAPRAIRTIYAEAVAYGVGAQWETGGSLGGVCKDGVWYIAEAIDAGPQGKHTWGDVHFDEDYQSYRLTALRRLYGANFNLVGLWHQHPNGLSVFSGDGKGPDGKTNRAYADSVGGQCISIIATTLNQVQLYPYLVDTSQRGLYGHPHYTTLAYSVSDIPARILPQKNLHDLQAPIWKSVAADAYREVKALRQVAGVEEADYCRLRNTFRINITWRGKSMPCYLNTHSQWRPHGQRWRTYHLGDVTEYVYRRKR